MIKKPKFTEHDYILEEIPRNIASRNGWLIFALATFVYALILILIFGASSDAGSDVAIYTSIFSALVFLPFYIAFARMAYKTAHTFHKEELSPDAQLIKKEYDVSEANEKSAQDEEIFKAICKSPWYFRYPVAIVILLLLLWFIDSTENIKLAWIIGVLWGGIVLAMIWEVVCLALVIGVAYLVFMFVASLPISVAVIIGAIIIAIALKRT